jgi:glycosyltransferase involved in cell wall biosynthesis
MSDGRASSLRVSVVIPAFNEEGLLADSLRSVSAAMKVFDELGWTSELIVCDNNSTDRTASIARAAGATVCVEPVNQIARARNTGATHATGDWLVFVDADSNPSAALFADVAQSIRTGRCLAGGSTVHLAGSHHWVVTALTHLWNALSRLTRWAPGSFIFCEAAAFQEVGGFSRELYAGEEIDLFRRFKRLARRRGRTIVILHEHPLLTSDRKLHLYTLRELLTFLAMTLFSRGRTLRSHQKCFAWYDGRRD